MDKEKELIEKAQQGDRLAFEALVKACAPKVYNYTLRLCRGNAQNAEDITQEAIINAYRNMGNFRADCSFSSWLMRIASNGWKNRVRYEKRRFFTKHDSLSDTDPEDGQEIGRDIPDRAKTPDEEFESTYNKERINRALGRIPDTLREIIVLRDMQELEYEELAAALGINIGTVKSRLSRAREALKNELLKEFGDDDGL